MRNPPLIETRKLNRITGANPPFPTYEGATLSITHSIVGLIAETPAATA